jgi:hypothetical protein
VTVSSWPPASGAVCTAGFDVSSKFVLVCRGAAIVVAIADGHDQETRHGAFRFRSKHYSSRARAYGIWHTAKLHGVNVPLMSSHDLPGATCEACVELRSLLRTK